MSSITFLISAVMTIFVLHGIDELNAVSAVNAVAINFQESTLEDSEKNTTIQSLKSSPSLGDVELVSKNIGLLKAGKIKVENNQPALRTSAI